MTVEYRVVHPDEFDEYIRLDNYSFGYAWSTEHTERMRATTSLDGALAAFVDGRMVAHVHLRPMTMWLNGAPLALGGVADVATWPEHRRQGHAGELMRRLLARMRDEGTALSMLYPSFYALYPRFGYGLASTYRRMLVGAPDLELRSAATEAGTVERIDLERWQELAALYDAALPDSNSAIGRDEQWWRERRLYSLKASVHAAVWRDGSGTARGYVLYERPPEPGAEYRQELHVRELVALTPHAYRALLGFMARHDLVDKLSWNGPEDDALPALLVNPAAAQTTLHPGFMLRVVDVVKALSERPHRATAPLAFTLALSDRSAPWNEGTWRVECDEGAVRVRRSDAEPDAVLDAVTLAALYNGFLRPAVARAAGALELTNEPALRALEHFFAASRRPFCYDEF